MEIPGEQCWPGRTGGGDDGKGEGDSVMVSEFFHRNRAVDDDNETI